MEAVGNCLQVVHVRTDAIVLLGTLAGTASVPFVMRRGFSSLGSVVWGTATTTSTTTSTTTCTTCGVLPVCTEQAASHPLQHAYIQWSELSYTSTAGVVLFWILSLYLILVIISNILVCYHFLAAWSSVFDAVAAEGRGDYYNTGEPQQQQLQQQTRRLQRQRLISVEHLSCIDDTLRVERFRKKNMMPANQLEQEFPTEHAASHEIVRSNKNDQPDKCCPICLLEFQDDQWVTFCEPDGCSNLFHKECLFAWLRHGADSDDAVVQYNTSCPCCRREMVSVIRPSDPATTMQPAWLSDLSTFMGYYVH